MNKFSIGNREQCDGLAPSAVARPILHLMLLVLTLACAAEDIELEASLELDLPKTVDIDSVGTLDWYAVTSDDLENSAIVAFDQRMESGAIESVTAHLNDEQSLFYSGVAQYQWATGSKYASLKEVAPGVQIQGPNTTGAGSFVVSINVPTDNSTIVIHGGNSHGSPQITAKIGSNVETTAFPAASDRTVSWSYALAVQNAKSQRLRISLSTPNGSESTSTLTIAAVMVGQDAES